MAKTPTYKNDIGVPVIKIGTKGFVCRSASDILKPEGRYQCLQLQTLHMPCVQHQRAPRNAVDNWPFHKFRNVYQSPLGS